MNRAFPHARELAGCLISFETGKVEPFETPVPSAFRVCERVRPHPATCLGTGGVQALLARSLARAGAGMPWLRSVQVHADGRPEGPERPGAPSGPEDIAEGGEMLLAQLLALLIAFTGETLTLQLVREVWLQLPPDDLKLGGGDTK